MDKKGTWDWLGRTSGTCKPFQLPFMGDSACKNGSQVVQESNKLSSQLSDTIIPYNTHLPSLARKQAPLVSVQAAVARRWRGAPAPAIWAPPWDVHGRFTSISCQTSPVGRTRWRPLGESLLGQVGGSFPTHLEQGKVHGMARFLQPHRPVLGLRQAEVMPQTVQMEMAVQVHLDRKASCAPGRLLGTED